MPARRGWDGEVCLPDARPDGKVQVHRRPCALRRIHRLPRCGRRGPTGLHVLQNGLYALFFELEPRRTVARLIKKLPAFL